MLICRSEGQRSDHFSLPQLLQEILKIDTMINKERFAPETPNVVGRKTLLSRGSPIDIQVCRSKVKFICHVGLPHLMQEIIQKHFATEASKVVYVGR